MAEAPWRLFVAVPVAPHARAAVSALLAGVPPDSAGRRPAWVAGERLHLTLRFLGPADPGLVPRLGEAVTAVAAAGRPFPVELAGAGGFPSLARPRALWLGIVAGAPELGALAAALGEALEPLGWPPDHRAYRPHLTVARTDAIGPAAASASAVALAAAAADWRTAFTAEHVALYRSHLGHGPARYQPLVEAPLGG